MVHSRFRNPYVSQKSEVSPLSFSLKKLWKLSSLVREYADLTVYVPDLEYDQAGKSSQWVWHKVIVEYLVSARALQRDS